MTSETAALRGPLRKRNSHLWARDKDDWYVEPQWCSTRLFELERFEGSVWDPACGMGRICEAARIAGLKVWATDLRDRGYKHQDYTLDFMEPIGVCSDGAEHIVSNPPFGIAEKFVAKALGLARGKVAMLLPANWIQGDTRSRWLQSTPLYRVLFITPRPSMPPGEVIKAGGNPGNGTTDYAWFVWKQGHRDPPTIGWIRKNTHHVRLRLEP